MKQITHIAIYAVMMSILPACVTSKGSKLPSWSGGFPSFLQCQKDEGVFAYGEKLLSENTKGNIPITPTTSNNGIKFWYVHDTSVPVIDIKFSFDKGAIYDQQGKEGTASLIAATLNEGAGKYSSQEFQTIMKDYAIDLYFDASKDKFSGHLRTTRTHLKKAVELLQLSILSPRFDDDAVERMKNEMLMSLRYRQSKPGWHAGKAMRNYIFTGHPYMRSKNGIEEAIPKITKSDIQKLWKQIAVRDGLIIGVTGDLSQNEADQVVDKVFSTLPKGSLKLNVDKARFNNKGKIVLVPRDGPQTYLLAAHKGINREHPDWFIAQIINYTLAGGGFNSRLVENVRVKNSLTYGISSSIVDQEYAPLWLVQSDVDNDGVKQTVASIKNEWRNVRDNGITQEELEKAKAYLIGALPLVLDSTAAISSLLVQMQEDDLPYDYLDNRSELIEEITISDVKRVAKSLLKPNEFTFILVGKYDQ